MAESIYLQLPRAPGPAHWLLVDALGNRIGQVQQGSLADAATQAHGRRLTAFVPGEQVSLFLADIPSRSLQKVQQAVPFLLEDKLAEDADVLHFAAGLRDTGGHLVAVTDQARMRLWLGEIAQAGLEPVQLMADTAALAIQPDTTVIALDGPYVMTRFPDGSGFTAEREFALGLLKRRLGVADGTDQARMRLWLGEIAQAGLEPVQLMADTAALAIQPDTTVIALDGPYVMTRFPDGSGFTAEREFALGLLKRRLGVADGTATPARVVIHATEADDAQGFIAALESTGAEFSQHALKDGVLPLLAAGLRQQRGVNLLQADFQPRSDFQEHWRVWRVAAVLFATCLLLLLIQQGMGYVRLRREATDLDAQVEIGRASCRVRV